MAWQPRAAACSFTFHLWDLSRSPSPECPLFLSSAFSLSRTHCGIPSVTQVSLVDKFRPRPTEKGTAALLAIRDSSLGLWAPSFLTVWKWYWQSGTYLNLVWSLSKKQHWCKYGSFSSILSPPPHPKLVQLWLYLPIFRSEVSFPDAFENWLHMFVVGLGILSCSLVLPRQWRRVQLHCSRQNMSFCPLYDSRLLRGSVHLQVKSSPMSVL